MKSVLKHKRAGVSQSGRSLLEILLVLVMFTVVTLLALTLFNKAMLKYKVNRTMEEMISLVPQIRNLYKGQSTYDNLSPEMLKAAGIFPTRWDDGDLSDGGTNDFGLLVYAGPDFIGGQRYINLSINMPHEACVLFMTKLFADRSLASADINEAGYALNLSGQASVPVPSVAEITQRCSESGPCSGGIYACLLLRFE